MKQHKFGWQKVNEDGRGEAQKRNRETLALTEQEDDNVTQQEDRHMIYKDQCSNLLLIPSSLLWLFPFIQIWLTSTFLKSQVSLTLAKGIEWQELRHGNTGQVWNVTNITEKSTQIVGRADIFLMTKFPNPFCTLQNPTTLVYRACCGTCRRLLKVCHTWNKTGTEAEWNQPISRQAKELMVLKRNGCKEEFWAQSGDSEQQSRTTEQVT